jgi:endo-1,4-beta-xylanase
LETKPLHTDTRKSRLNFIFLLLVIAVGITQGQTLRSLADAHGIHFGAAVKFPTPPDMYDSTLAHQFNGLVCENAMKFENIMTGPTTFNYSSADAIINFGVARGMYLRGHTFIWHKQNPSWFMNLNITRDSAFKLMNYYIKTVMTHYKGKIKEWDIVNEAVARDSSGMRLGSGYAETVQNSKWAALTDAANHNFDYIDSAYTYARRADSSVLLFYNDYNCEGMGKKSEMVYNLVTRLKNQKLIDGIGLQCHYHLIADTGVNGAWNLSEMENNLKRLTGLGLRISFTEVDIRIPAPRFPMTAVDSANLLRQRNEYASLLRLFLAQPNRECFYIWGVNDTQSWVPDVFKGYGSPLLFSNTRGNNGEYIPKPCYYGIQEVFLTTTSVLRQTHNRTSDFSPVENVPDQICDLLGRRMKSFPYSQQSTMIKPSIIKLDYIRAALLPMFW